MASVGKIARRSFLIGSAAVLGGAAFGVYQIAKDAPNPLESGEGIVALNPYVVVTTEGVTIIAPRAEMGQGVHTTLAALVAEEMDLPWEDITVLHGPPAQAYFNQALLGLGLPFRHYADTEFRHNLRTRVGMVGKLLNLQVTGGSTSIKDAYDRMRRAGASAREALKEAAAAELGVAMADLRTEGGAVIAPDGTALRYAELAPRLAGIEAREVEPRPSSQWKMLGKSQPRTDVAAKSTGTATYAGDIKAEGMRFATIRMNPRRSGMISFDASAAEAMAGVEMIVDLGDGIGVIATNTWLAMQAADAVEIEWEAASYPAETEELLAAIEASLDTAPDSTIRDDGDVTRAVEGTEITATYRVPFLAHATMEPLCASAIYRGDSLEVWAGNQAPVIVRDKCAEAVGLAPEAVTLHTTFLGGGFGRRGEYDFSVPAAKLAQAMPDTLIRCQWSREEDMQHDFYRPAAIGRYRGVVRDGKAVLVDGAVAGPSVTHNSSLRLAGQVPPGPDRGHVEGSGDQPYAIPNFRVTGHLTPIDVPLGFWRSVGNSFNPFFFDCFLDEMAAEAGADPLQFRLDMIRPEHAPSALVLEKVAEMSNWTGQTPEGRGRGVAFTYSFGTAVAEVVEVAQTDQGIRIEKVWIACDVGRALDPSIIEAQMTGGAIFGLSAAVMGEITFADGAAEQENFWDYDALRMHNTPAFEVAILENQPHLGGVGEPGTPPAAPALANALYDLTGTRARELPLIKTFDLIL